MLASRASSARQLTRSFATVVDAAGYKVAAVDYNQPTAAVTVLAKAGTRFESKPGVAHALKNFAFKSTTKRSALGTVRESELYGGVLSTTLSREYLALTAEFLRGDEPFFVDLLASFITSAKFTRHEFEEYVTPVVESESLAAAADPATHAVELAHALAFRNGLGASLFASPHSAVTAEDVKAFAASAFAKGNIAIIGTGIAQDTLSQLVAKSFAAKHAAASAVPAISAPATGYFGGETRVAAHGAQETVFIGFGAAGAPSADLAALAAHLSPAPSVKWSQGITPLAAQIPTGASVRAVYLPYADATLVGLLVQAPTAAGVREAGAAAVKALQGAAGSVSGEALKSAVAKAKFAAASAVDGRDGLVAALGAKALAGTEASLDATLSSLDKVSTSSFTSAASSLLKGKPTYVAIGSIDSLPYADELGL